MKCRDSEFRVFKFTGEGLGSFLVGLEEFVRQGVALVWLLSPVGKNGDDARVIGVPSLRSALHHYNVGIFFKPSSHHCDCDHHATLRHFGAQPYKYFHHQ